VFALSDTPFTNPPYSQKRLTKSIERSAAWLAHLLQPLAISLPTPSITSDVPAVDANRNTQEVNDYHPNIFLQLAGSTSLPARRAFADSLIEMLHGKEADAIRPLRCLDDGVQGYVFDLVPLRMALAASKAVQSRDDQGHLPNSNPLPDGDANLKGHATLTDTSTLILLLHASLASLPPTKPRIVNSPRSPHEILRLIREVGIDVFDARWALDAANVGVALDFVFPIPVPDTVHMGKMRNGKRDLGHNLYEKEYEFDFESLAGSMRGALSADVQPDVDKPVCTCAACSPVRPHARNRIVHAPSDVVNDRESQFEGVYNPPYTRAYIHHLLHTHEMAAHTWLMMHNLAVLDAFLGGVRTLLREDRDSFTREVARFEGMYHEGICDGHAGDTEDEGEGGLFGEARNCWKEVELARGKGRLAREKAKVEQHLETQGDNGL
jgi:Queuine tRNA-ribosyltransferase